MKDLNANDIEMAMKTIEGSARAMSLEKWWRAEPMATKKQKAQAATVSR